MGSLDGMADLVEILKTRISDSSEIGNEATTRYSLIDPVLRELGWDTEDPRVVVPEYSSGAGRADYALFNEGGKPAVIIEAKKLGEPLGDAADQGINYCVRAGIEYFAVTDGNAWRVYETHKPVPTHDKLIQSFDIDSMRTVEVCVRMLVLWRRYIGSPDVASPGPPSQTASAPSAPRKSSQGTESPRQGNSAYRPITSMVYNKGDPGPVSMRLPDKSTVNIGSWVDILVQTATWLIKEKHITRDKCPVRSGRLWMIVSTTPRHGNGRPFLRGLKMRGLHLERHTDPKGSLAKSIQLVEHAGLDPRDFEVKAR